MKRGANDLLLSAPLEHTKVQVKWRREVATHHNQGTHWLKSTHRRAWQRPQFVSKRLPGNTDLRESLSKTYSHAPEMIIWTNPKQPHALSPGSSPTWKRFRFWERRELVGCFLWMNRTSCCILCHKDYYTVYISERRIRKQNTAQGG